MGFISCYKEGMRLFQEKEYAKAIECFDKGLNVGNDSDCALMLGKCFEYGLGVEEDLVTAKDCYKSALIKFGFMHSPDCEEILWLKSKIGEMSDIPDINELSRYIEPVGWVKVKRTRRRAEYIFPMKLKEVSERIGVPYGRCKISPTLSKSYAYFTIKTHDVTFALRCFDLPEESIEAICVHELMHTFSADHNSRFYTKLKEYGGQRLYDRDFRLEDGITWRRLRLIKG